MDKRQAQGIIRETFEAPFDKGRFTGFVKNLLNRIDDAPFTYQGNYIPAAYTQYIKTLERIGKFSDGENSIDILVITLLKETSLECARTMQRNFVAWYLNGSRGGELKDAALVAYVSPDNEDWRFSLVKMDYKFEKTAAGRIKVKEEFTPARRWSFLVGANEKSHTAQSRLVNILADDENAPTLQEIEKAFDIETVTREFFLKYRELFIRTKEALDRLVKDNPLIKADFEAKGVDTVNFAKKLLGQIVFLYFLQKKGWFGVGRNAEWGTGSKQFLRELFEKRHSDYKNFFNDILEPLFYEALRMDRGHDDHYYSRFDCKIPFLNGGLFDPIANYDWVRTDVLLPDSLFSNKVKTKEGDIGDGILDVFDRYNFTVKEDEPLEKEVAIDPELLGKAYEKFNAIRPDNFDEYKKALKSGKKGEESKFNKQFGVYYTPREIVHYMCRESLINYLYTELSDRHSGPVSENGVDSGRNPDPSRRHSGEGRNPEVSREDIEVLIHTGEHVSENEATALLKEKLIEEGKQKTTKNKLVLPESIRKNAKQIDDKLADITVCDPAVGSGAFPVGMMSEIIKTRTVLTTFINPPSPSDKEEIISLSPIEKGGTEGGSRTPYDFKRRCIEHSLYGVDIDPGAVEIAKLRLWLSLVVDEDDIKNIKPLPNLDYKIVCGNSLLGYPYTPAGLEKIERLKELFFEETNPTKKNELRTQIDDAIYSLYKNTEKSLGYKVTMDFKINFSEVFHPSSSPPLSKGGTEGGFDVVIANPPYIRQEAIKDDKPHLAKAFNDFFCGTADIYTYFYKRGIDILKPFGHLCFIAPNKFMRAGYGKNTRHYLVTQATPKLIIDFGELSVFEAGTDPAIILVEKAIIENGYFTATTIKTPEEIEKVKEIVGERGLSLFVSMLKTDG